MQRVAQIQEQAEALMYIAKGDAAKGMLGHIAYICAILRRNHIDAIPTATEGGSLESIPHSRWEAGKSDVGTSLEGDS